MSWKLEILQCIALTTSQEYGDKCRPDTEGRLGWEGLEEYWLGSRLQEDLSALGGRADDIYQQVGRLARGWRFGYDLRSDLSEPDIPGATSRVKHADGRIESRTDRSQAEPLLLRGTLWAKFITAAFVTTKLDWRVEEKMSWGAYAEGGVDCEPHLVLSTGRYAEQQDVRYDIVRVADLLCNILCQESAGGRAVAADGTRWSLYSNRRDPDAPERSDIDRVTMGGELGLVVRADWPAATKCPLRYDAKALAAFIGTVREQYKECYGALTVEVAGPVDAPSSFRFGWPSAIYDDLRGPSESLREALTYHGISADLGAQPNPSTHEYVVRYGSERFKRRRAPSPTRP